MKFVSAAYLLFSFLFIFAYTNVLRSKNAFGVPIDATYFDTAAKTGGDFFIWEPGEFRSTSSIIPLIFGTVPVHLAYGDLKEGKKEFIIPIESRVKELSFFVGIQYKPFIIFLNPSGKRVSPLMENVKALNTSHMFIGTIQNPEIGEWRLKLSGAGLFSSSLRVPNQPFNVERRKEESYIELYKFEFVRLENPIHPGYFAISGLPLAGSNQKCLATILGTFQTARFRMVSLSGETIGQLELKRGDPNIGQDEFLGRCKVPHQPFRIAVTGLDLNGKPYQRFLTNAIDPKVE